VAWLHGRTKVVRQAQKEEREAKTTALTEHLIVVSDPYNAAAESYRTLRTNLLHTSVEDSLRVILVTSPGRGEGKTHTCANLSVALTQAGKNTLAVDCDLRSPNLHRYFGLDNVQGIVDVLMGKRNPQEVWEESVNGLKVLSTGPILIDPTELLYSWRFSEFIASVQEEFDYVVLDSPAVGIVSDPLILATQSDGVLLVLDAQNTPKVAVWRSARSLKTVRAPVIGTVVNNWHSGEQLEGDKHEYY
jgi:capsular exopolysaccharide synthesis family protein